MIRILAWTTAGLAALLVLFTLALIASGEDGVLRRQVDGSLRQMVVDVPPVAAYTTRVLALTEPFVVTVDECDPAVPYVQSYGYSNGFLNLEVRVLGRSVPEALAHFLGVRSEELVFAQAPPAAIVDVHARRYAGLMAHVSDTGSRDELERAAADALCRAYDLQLAFSTVEADVPVLRAGPRFAELLTRNDRGGHSRITRGDGVFAMRGLRVSSLLDECRRRATFRFEELPDCPDRYDVDLSWDPHDPHGFERALSERLDLNLVREPREVPRVLVSPGYLPVVGSATPATR